MGSEPLHCEEFELDLHSYQLNCDGRVLRLERQPMELLILLVEHHGELVTREQMAARLWDDGVFVDAERGINNAVRKLRVALKDDAEHPRYLQTVVGKGYRFIGPVRIVPAAGRRETTTEPHPGEAPGARGATGKRQWVRIAGVAASITLIAVITLRFIGSKAAGARVRPPASIHSLAVLPLRNLNSNSSQDYLADGMTEALISDLGRIKTIRVVSRTTAMSYKDTRKPLRQIARELNVDALVQGSIRRDGEDLYVTAQLRDARQGRRLWAANYDRSLREILNLEDALAYDVAMQIGVTPASEEARHLVNASRVVDPQGYLLYLKSRYFPEIERTVEGTKRSLQYAQQAVQLDPDDPLALAGLADAYANCALHGGVAPKEVMPKAKAAALQAIQLDDSLGEAHNSLAKVLYDYDWDWRGAEREFQRALQLDPNYSDAHVEYAHFLASQGRFDEAIDEAKFAYDLDPLSVWKTRDVGIMLYYAHRYDEAIKWLQQAAELNRSSPVVYNWLAWAYDQQGHHRLAAQASLTDNANNGFSAPHLALLRRAYRISGARGYWAALLQLYLSHANGPGSSYQIALIYARLGEGQQAIRWLLRGYVERDIFYASINADPAFDPLRSDPRFQELLRKMGLTVRPSIQQHH